ncbi:MAG TPA: 16S rRNA (cytosine(1402)-N(4))-methyltransferase RsmH [Acidimicrobiia bacterium]|jgi:16S rRNA (cytosine1402-N4)-methyltransferase|nr:16S rRNA (cytosine(1402)-N(4))-methyltransferase RsmH [Acidimicrobiia bacterium]
MNQGPDNEQVGYHRPVLADEVIELMAPVVPGVIVDATFGGGGHTRRLLDEFGDEVSVIAIDRDPEAVANAARLAVTVIEGNFADIDDLVRSVTDEPISGVLFDFGVSSRQLDHAERGFSYRHEGPLDMRMGPDAVHTADEIVNTWSIEDLARIIRRYGEEPMARRIAEAIVTARPIQSTAHLSTVIAQAMPAARRRAGHPARRTFQAIRIAVNEELQAVEQGVSKTIDMLRPGGRIVAISYHSLEDRIVKQEFAERARGCTCPPDLPVCGCGNAAEVRILTRKPIRPSQAEIEANNRARSAVLRAAEKVAA